MRMNVAMRVVLTSAVAVLAIATPASAQYMYLDANGNGTHEMADQLNASGPTVVELWIDTAHNRDGSVANCPGGANLSIISYEMILRVTGGTVTWGSYTNLRTGMGISFGSASDSTDFYRGFGGGTINAPGLYHLGSLVVSVTGGNPSIDFAPSTSLSAGYLTAFGSQCPGLEGDNTLRLGADWLDTDGALPPDISPMIMAPPSVSTEEGATVAIETNAVSHLAESIPAVTATGFPSSLALQVLPDGANASKAILSGHIGANDAGSYTVVWTATDETGGSSTDSTSLNIVEHNFPPVVGAPPAASGPEGAPISFVVYAYDDDDDAITSFTASLVNLPAGSNATFTTNGSNTQGTFNWTPAFNHAGSYTVIFTASNFVSASDNTVITVTEGVAEWMLRVHMPFPESRVDVSYFSVLCQPGGASLREQDICSGRQ